MVDDKKDLNSNIKFLLSILILFIILIFDKNILIEKIFISSFNLTINLKLFLLIFNYMYPNILNAFNMFDGMNMQSGSYSLFIITSLFIYSEEFLFLIILFISGYIFIFKL